MAIGKMNHFIEIVTAAPVAKDADGFAIAGDTVLASVRAYMENRHGSKGWANRAAFSTATALFRFRRIPNLTVDTTMSIICEGTRYTINSAENIRSMYTEVLAEKQEGAMR